MARFSLFHPSAAAIAGWSSGVNLAVRCGPVSHPSPDFCGGCYSWRRAGRISRGQTVIRRLLERHDSYGVGGPSAHRLP